MSIIRFGAALGLMVAAASPTVAFAASTPATSATPSVTAQAASAAAKPNFQMPFPCKYSATAATYSGHKPAWSVDFQKAGITGDKVVASAAGKVTRVENEGAHTSYGKWIEIQHAGGWSTRYAHLSVQSVKVNQTVALGSTIGLAGATGKVSGPHMHYEQRLSGINKPVVLDGRAVPYYGHTTFTSHNKCNGTDPGNGNPYTPREVCGSGFTVIDKHGLGKAGTTYLLYNPSTKQNCVATLKATGLGKKTSVSAMLQVKGESAKKDAGNFSYYAGPVKAKAPGKCVKWGGSAGSSSYTSPFEHCG